MSIYEFEDLEEGIYPVLLSGQSKGFEALTCELVIKRDLFDKLERYLRENANDDKIICQIEVLGPLQFDLTFNNYGFETKFGLLSSDINLINSLKEQS
jgi:hypothetical protein